MFKYLILKYKELSEVFLEVLDQYHDNSSILNVHPDENIYKLINHLVKFTDYNEKLKHIKLKNEKIEDQYHLVIRWWNHLLA